MNSDGWRGLFTRNLPFSLPIFFAWRANNTQNRRIAADVQARDSFFWAYEPRAKPRQGEPDGRSTARKQSLRLAVFEVATGPPLLLTSPRA